MLPAAVFGVEHEHRLGHDHLAELRDGPHWSHAERSGPSPLDAIRGLLGQLAERIAGVAREVDPAPAVPPIRDYPYSA